MIFLNWLISFLHHISLKHLRSVSAYWSLHVLGHNPLLVDEIDVTINGRKCKLVMDKLEHVLIDKFEMINMDGVLASGKGSSSRRKYSIMKIFLAYN